VAFAVTIAARLLLFPTLTGKRPNDAAGFASRYGPLSCSPQRGFRRWASTRPVSRPSRQPATGPPDSYPDGTHTRRRQRAYVGSATQQAPPTLGAHRKRRAAEARRQLVARTQHTPWHVWAVACSRAPSAASSPPQSRLPRWESRRRLMRSSELDGTPGRSPNTRAFAAMVVQGSHSVGRCGF
jgi:hypothetical protein